MKIVVEPLKSSLEQTFNAKKRTQIHSISAWIYKHLSPAGAFKIEIWQAGAKLTESDPVTSSDIETNTNSTNLNYYHGYYRFLFSGAAFVNEGDFILKLVQTGYTYSDSAYLGWVKPHESITVDLDYTPVDAKENPFGVQIWKWEGFMTRIVDIDDGFTAGSVPTIEAEYPIVTGSVSAPQEVPVGGIVIQDVLYEVIFIAGDGGAIDITGNPQIPSPTNQGATLTLIGTHATNTVKLETGDGLYINGPIIMDDEAILTLQFTDGLWRQVSSNI